MGIDEQADPFIVIDPALDVWSIGMTVCELVILDAALKPMYASFLRHGRSNHQAGFLFMEWLSGITKLDLDKSITRFDKEMVDLLSNWLLVANKKNRKTLAESLNHPY